MKLELAQSAGFCYGVRRAVELAEQTAGDGEPCVMLGSIIHNQDVIGRLEERGLRVVQRPDEVPAGCRVIIRSHGESRAVYEALQARNARILDATCPNVKRIHEIVSRAEEQGRQVVIVGTPDHPEVTAIAGWCRNAAVLPGEEDFPPGLSPPAEEVALSRTSAGEIADRLGLEPSIAADCLRSLLAEDIVTAEDTGSGRVYRLRW